jgi:NTP pyrophosphatase (non-canonical NTP hydrolase)
LNNFDEYQHAAFATAMYPAAGTGEWPALAYTALGLGEVGELQGKIKKIYRDHGGEISDATTAAVAAELGDVLWYVAVMAVELGIPLSDIAERNIAKLRSRAERGVITGSGDER